MDRTPQQGFKSTSAIDRIPLPILPHQKSVRCINSHTTAKRAFPGIGIQSQSLEMVVGPPLLTQSLRPNRAAKRASRLRVQFVECSRSLYGGGMRRVKRGTAKKQGAISANRSWNMAQIRSTDTAPERAVRSYLHAAGLRYLLHDKRWSGRPDLVFPRHRVVVFVHGCFWHRHKGCRFTTNPATNVRFWKRKFEDNVNRDEANSALLARQGWHVLVIWGCKTRDDVALDRLYWRIRATSREREATRSV